MSNLTTRLQAERERTYRYVCDRCEWETDGLNTYLAHKCDPGRRALVLYQRRVGAKQPTSPYIT